MTVSKEKKKKKNLYLHHKMRSGKFLHHSGWFPSEGNLIRAPWSWLWSGFWTVIPVFHRQQREEAVLLFCGMSHRAKFRAFVSGLPLPPAPPSLSLFADDTEITG